MLQYAIDGLGKAACLPGLKEEHMRRLRHEAAIAVSSAVKDNFNALEPNSPHSHFWGKAEQSVHIEEGPKGAKVAIYQKGVRLRLLGGVVRPTGKPSEVTGKPTKSLLIPFNDSPLRLQNKTLHELHYPQENIHVIKSKNGCPILVASDPKDKQAIVGLGKLVKQSTHAPNPKALPTQQVMTEKARAAVREGVLDIMRELSQ